VATTPFRDAALADSPEVLLLFNETSGTTIADEKAAHPSTYVNGPTLGVAGLNGAVAATFDRAQSQRGLLDTLGSLGANLGTSSWEAVFKTANTANQGALFATLNTGATTGVQLLLNANASGSYLAGSTQFFIRGQSSETIQATITTNIYDGLFHHLVVVVDSATTVAIYVDGVAQTVTYATQTAQATFSNFEFPLTVAARNNRATIDLFAAVTLDAFAAYPTRLTAARVTAHYASL